MEIEPVFLTRTREIQRGCWMSEHEPRGKAGRHVRISTSSGAVKAGGRSAWLVIRAAMPSGALGVGGGRMRLRWRRWRGLPAGAVVQLRHLERLDREVAKVGLRADAG
jgi:hypothetical protein